MCKKTEPAVLVPVKVLESLVRCVETNATVSVSNLAEAAVLLDAVSQANLILETVEKD